VNQTAIIYDHQSVCVNLVGTDQKLIPSLLSALRHNKFTLNSLKSSLERIDLFSAEAILHAADGNKARIPIF
jgi:hypothetical protein